MAAITNRCRRTRHWTIDGWRRRPADRRMPSWATGTVEEKLAADPIEEHHCLHDGRTGRIGETLRHTFVVVKAVLDRCWCYVKMSWGNSSAASAGNRSRVPSAERSSMEKVDA